MERIVIKNFGPIKDVDLEINDFMIFIGPQASGKSTIAKLVYFFKNLQNEFKSFLFERASFNIIRRLTEEFEGNLALLCVVEYFIDIFSDTRIYRNSEVKFYFREDFEVKLEFDKEGLLQVFLSDQFSNDFDETLKEARRIFDDSKNDYSSARSSISFLIDTFVYRIFDKNLSQNLYIPEGRGFISTIESQSLNLKTENLDYFIREFASTIRFIQDNISLEDETLRRESEEIKKKYLPIYDLLKRLQHSILKGRYLFNEEDGKIGIEIENKIFIPLNKASSGQQEAVWIIQYIISRIHKITYDSLFTVIEEPEAHLYPEAQKSITELIVLLANMNLLNSRLIVTTHSPYILASINNLLYANKVGKSHKKEVSEKIDKNLWLDYTRVGAYFVGGEDNEGGIKRIMDDELEMIKSEYVDSASQIINEEFDFIFALED